MQCRPVLGVLVLPLLAFPVAASSQVLPQPLPEPLAVLVRDSRTIHVLRVEAADGKSVTFRVATALKGKASEAPFRVLYLYSNEGNKDLFRAGDTVLCFCRGDVASGDGTAVGTLFVQGRWALAISPSAGRGEENWFCMAEERYGPTFVGSTEALRDAVTAILAGRETTILARAPVPWSARGTGRLWRIKTGPMVTRFVLSDDSPYFVGWGTGDPDEAAKLARTLRDGTLRERLLAAEDLAYLGAAARSALPALRRALKDSDFLVSLAAARALAQLDPKDRDGVETILGHLGSEKLDTRYAAIRFLGDLGPKASAALPLLLKALTDGEEPIRAAAVEAVGRVAQDSPSTARAVAGLAALLKNTKHGEDAQLSTVRALQGFGPQSWESLDALRKMLLRPDHASDWSQSEIESMTLFARFDPPPVEVLAEMLANRASVHDGRGAAARNLDILGSRARLALPILRRVLQDASERQEDPFRESIRLHAAQAILDIDPEGSPSLVAPVVLKLAKERNSDFWWAYYLLGRCGKAAKPSLPALLAQLSTKDHASRALVRDLTDLLGPEDRELLPQVQSLLAELADGIDLADVLLRLGEREKAVAHATRCLDKEELDHRVLAARWLGERGREAKTAEPALRRALEKATGVERARLALTLWRVCGPEGSNGQRRALTALDRLLSVCEGKDEGMSRFAAGAFWQPESLGWEEDAAVGAAVATVYDRLQDKDDAGAVLTRGLRDPDAYVRLASVVALARVQPDQPDTVPALRKLLEHHPHFFCYLVETLAALGPRAASLAPLVQPLLRHPNDDVWRAASRVMHRIDPALAAKGWGAAGAPGAVPENLVPLWDDLATDDALRADLAVWRLAGAGARAVTLLRERLRPPAMLSTERIAQLIADLDSEDFTTRQRASSELAGGIESAAPALRRTLATKPTAEVRSRIQTLLEGLDPTRDPEQRRRVRAVRLLEEMGSPEAHTFLERLSHGDARFALTREAQTALPR